MAKKIKIKPSRKELLKEEDEFISFTEQAFKWGTANWPIVIIALAVIVAVALIGIMLKSNLEKSKKEYAYSFEEALETLNAPVETGGQSPQNVNPGAIIYSDEKQKYEAVAFKLEKVVKEKPNSELAAFARLYLADTNLQLGKYEEAVKEYDVLINNQTGQGAVALLAKHNKGIALYMQKKYEEALPLFVELAESDTPLAKASSLVYAGRCSEQLGKVEDAVKYYQRAVDSYSDSVLTNGLKEKIARLKIASNPSAQPASVPSETPPSINPDSNTTGEIR